MEITAFTIWYVVGIAGFVYWWGRDMRKVQQDNPESTSILFLTSMLMGFFGVFTWIIGYYNNKT